MSSIAVDEGNSNPNEKDSSGRITIDEDIIREEGADVEKDGASVMEEGLEEGINVVGEKDG